MNPAHSRGSAKPWLILKVGSTVEILRERRGDFDDWFRAALDAKPGATHVVRPAAGERPQQPDRYRGVIVTGSPSNVTDDEVWSLETERWIEHAVHLGVPFLGVCYGHQLLARAFGGRVADNPRGREIGTVQVSLTAAGQSSPLYEGLGPELLFQATHSQSVLEPPHTARVLAENEHDPYQSIEIGPCGFGVQFHPEFDADIMRGYLTARGAELASEGLDPAELGARLADGDAGRRLLANFSSLAAAHGPRSG